MLLGQLADVGMPFGKGLGPDLGRPVRPLCESLATQGPFQGADGEGGVSPGGDHGRTELSGHHGTGTVDAVGLRQEPQRVLGLSTPQQQRPQIKRRIDGGMRDRGGDSERGRQGHALLAYLIISLSPPLPVSPSILVCFTSSNGRLEAGEGMIGLAFTKVAESLPEDGLTAGSQQRAAGKLMKGPSAAFGELAAHFIEHGRLHAAHGGRFRLALQGDHVPGQLQGRCKLLVRQGLADGSIEAIGLEIVKTLLPAARQRSQLLDLLQRFGPLAVLHQSTQALQGSPMARAEHPPQGAQHQRQARDNNGQPQRRQ